MSSSVGAHDAADYRAGASIYHRMLEAVKRHPRPAASVAGDEHIEKQVMGVGASSPLNAQVSNAGVPDRHPCSWAHALLLVTPQDDATTTLFS
jgi:hypothetical protein